MSTSIEDRIVEMQFDNAQFEQGAKTTMNTLKDLDNSLKFENGAKGFAAISEAASRVDLSSLIGGVESVGHSFSALEVAAITVISRITSAIMDAVMGISRELLVKPISEGYEEYETKMDMVQTTMVNSGKSLEEVNATLDDLNHYADKTIFKFMDMTQALKKFTMAGITDLDVAKTMIEGIGNIAGEAGLKTEQASSAFYMISQAMSQGKMSLYQFRTLESTGFASVKFRQNLLDTAVALGKIKDVGDGVYSALTDHGKEVTFTIESLRNNLTNTGWFDKDVMQALFSRYASEEANIALGFEDISKAAFAATTDVKTFSQMWDTIKEAAQSGWTTSWETIVGDYEQSKQLWTNVNNVISGVLDRQSDKRNKMLSDWAKLGGRTAALEGIANVWRAIDEIISRITRNFKEVFPSITGKRLAEMSKAFQSLTEKLKPSMTTLNYIGYVTRILADTLKKVFDTVKYGWGIVKMAFNDIFPTGLIDKFVNKSKALQKLFEFYKAIVKDTSQVFLVNFGKVRRIFRGLFAVVDIGINLITSLVEAFMPLVQKIFPKASGGITELIAKFGDFLVSVRDWVTENQIFKKTFEGIANAVTTVIDALSKVAGFIKKVFKPSWDVLKECFHDAFDNKDNEENVGFFETLLHMLKALVEGIGKALAKILPIAVKIGKFFSNVLKKVMENITKFIEEVHHNSAGSITAIAAAAGTLVGANGLWKLIDNIGDFFSAIKDWSKGISGVLIGFDDLINGFNELKDQAKFEMIARSLKQVSIAILLLAASFIMLTMADLDKVGLAFAIITATMGELIGTMAALNGMTKGKDTLGLKMSPIQQITAALLTFAAGVLVMSIALTILSKIDSDKLANSLLAITTLLAEMTTVAVILSKYESDFRKASKSLTKMAVATIIFSIAVKMLAKLESAQLVRGIVALTSILAVLTGFVFAMNKIKPRGLKAVGAAMIEISIAMLIFSKAVGKLGEMDVESLVKGVGTIAVILLAIIGFSKLLGKAGASLVYAGVAMIAIAAAMIVFAGAIALIGMQPWQQLLTGVVVIAALIAGLTLASNLVKPVKLIAIAAGLAVMAASIMVFALAMKVLSTIPWQTSLVNMAIILGSLLALGGLAALLTPVLGPMAILVGLFALFAVSILMIGAGMVSFAAGITALGIAIATFGSSLMVGLTAVLSLIPMFFEMVGVGIVAFITAIASSATTLITAIVEIGTALLDALIQLIPKFCEFVVVLITSLIDAAIALFPKIKEFLVALTQFIFDTLVELTPIILDGIVRVGKAIIDKLVEWGKTIWPYVKDILVKIKDKVVGFKDKLVDAGKQLINGLIQGIKDKIQDAVNAVKELGEKVIDKVKGVFDIHSPSRVAYGIGEFFDLGLMNGISDTSHRVVSAAAKMGDATVNMLKQTISNIAEIVANDDYQPTITPVLDLSNIEEGRQTLKDLLDNQNGGSYTASIVGRLSSISGKINHPDKSDQPTNITNNYNMTQNNTSPKALSASDIYRNTKSQFAQLKGAIGNA